MLSSSKSVMPNLEGFGTSVLEPAGMFLAYIISLREMLALGSVRGGVGDHTSA